MKKSLREHGKKGVQFAYILDAINLDDYLNEEGVTDKLSEKDKLTFTLKMVVDCLGYEVHKDGINEVFKHYIEGLGSGVNIAFENYAIIEKGKEWGYCKDARSQYRFVNNWFAQITFNFFQMCRLAGVDVEGIEREAADVWNKRRGLDV